jgi:exonuclease III
MLKLISINIEGAKHLSLTLPFLQKENPDVVYIQEIRKKDSDFIGSQIGMKGVFAPMCYNLVEGEQDLFGIAIFSKHELQHVTKNYYSGLEDDIPYLDQTKNPQEYHTMINRVLLGAQVLHSRATYQLATTHFTWTPRGETESYQLEDLKKLEGFLNQLPGFILAGDFNAPRGGEVYDDLAKKYTDDIPEKYDNSLDPVLHRLHNTRHLMVDGLFTTPKYKVTDAHLVPGVSDHQAIVASIMRE